MTQKITVHPAADCVRLMDAEELASLAASIEAHGLRDPIILGRVNGVATEMLVDGRNRLHACEIAGVEPRFEIKEFENDDAVKAFVADKSEHRNLTKAQQAMRLALLYPEPEKGGRGKHQTVRKPDSFSKQRLSEARSVLAYSRELALAVRDGTKKLDDALDEVKAARNALSSDESKRERLHSEAPDLAELVDEDRMPLSEACAALEQRIADIKQKEREEQDARRRHTMRVYEILLQLNPRHGVDDWLAHFARDIDASVWPSPNMDTPLTAQTIDACADALHALARYLDGESK
jgi:hypothetical protein